MILVLYVTELFCNISTSIFLFDKQTVSDYSDKLLCKQYIHITTMIVNNIRLKLNVNSFIKQCNAVS